MNLAKECNGGIEIKRKFYDNITPHKIAILIFIREYCNVIQTKHGDFLAPKYRRGFNVLILELIQSPDMLFADFSILLNANKNKLQPEHLKNFYEEIRKKHTDNIEALLNIISMLDKFIVDPINVTANCVVNKSSCLGLFLRRQILALERMSFHKVKELVQAFENYIGNSQYKFTKQKDAMVMQDDKCINFNKIAESKRNIVWSQRQSDLFLAQQSNLMLHNEKEALDPKIIKSKTDEFLIYNNDYSEAHFLNYLNCIRVREYCGAMNSLYQCFDRGAVNEDRVRETRGFRYSALNLAMLHADFNQRQGALNAIKECIMLAQECNDHVCLQLALVCLAQHNFLDSSKVHENLLQKAVTRCLELSLSQTASLAMQSRVQSMAFSGSIPFILMEIMRKSDLLNCQNSMVDLMSNSYSQKVALWQLYGKTDLANVFAQLLLHLNTSYMTQGSYPYNGEGICIAICKTSTCLPYYHADHVLEHARDRCRRVPLTINWMQMQFFLCFEYYVHSDFWQDAEMSGNQMVSINTWESLILKAQLNIFYVNLPIATLYINQLIDNCHQDRELNNVTEYKIRALTLKAQIKHVCFYVIGETITNLNTASVLSCKNYLDYNSAILRMNTAAQQLQMNLPNQALKIIDKVILCVLANGTNFDIARSLLLFVKCKISSLLRHKSNTLFKNNILLKCAIMLNKVIYYLQLDNAHSKMKYVLYFQAMLYNEINLPNERNKSSYEYRILEEQFKTSDGYNMLISF